MYPGFFFWKGGHRHGGCGAGAEEEAGCGPHFTAASGFGAGGFGDFGGGAFGIRRPLRFLAWKLDLSEEQVATLAKILDELKTERAQAEVDGRRTIAAFADALAGETFDAAKAAEGGALRVRSAEKLRDAVIKALTGIHALLESEQRTRLAHLVRTGIVLL